MELLNSIRERLGFAKMKNKPQKIKEMALVGIFVAMMCVVSQIAIPMPSGVPITLQILMIAFLGYFFNLKKAILSILIYVLIGFVGVPVFSGFQGGFGVLFGPTGGFIWGFAVIAVLCALSPSKKAPAILIGILSVLICHILGVIQYSILTKSNFVVAFVAVSLPYTLKDIAFVPIAYALSLKIKKLLKEQKEI